jgi:hypothetical protein
VARHAIFSRCSTVQQSCRAGCRLTRTHRLGCAWYPIDCGLAELYSGKCRTSVLSTGSWSLAAPPSQARAGPVPDSLIPLLPLIAICLVAVRNHSLTTTSLLQPANAAGISSLIYRQQLRSSILTTANKLCGSSITCRLLYLAVDRPHTQSTTAPVAPKHRWSSQSFAHHWRRHLGHQRTPGSSLCQASSSSPAQPLAVLHAYYRARVVTGGSHSRYGFTSAICLLCACHHRAAHHSSTSAPCLPAPLFRPHSLSPISTMRSSALCVTRMAAIAVRDASA